MSGGIASAMSLTNNIIQLEALKVRTLNGTDNYSELRLRLGLTIDGPIVR